MSMYVVQSQYIEIVNCVFQDAIRYSIISGVPGSLYFGINAGTGVISVAAALTQTGIEQFIVSYSNSGKSLKFARICQTVNNSLKIW